VSAKGRRRLKWFAITLVGIVLLWIGVEFTYSRVMLHRYEEWNETIERDADGVRLGCNPFTIGEGDTALLFIHGYSDSPAIYRKMATRLAEMGFTCRAMLRPGCARPLELYEKTTREKWLTAVGEETAALRETHREVWIVAHSLGGAITIDYLLDNPDAVDGVVLLAPLIAVSSERSPVLSAQTWYKIGKPMMIFTEIVENPFEVDAHSEEAQGYDMYSRFFPRKLYDEIFAVTDNIQDRAGELVVPVLMVLSRDDDIIDSEAAHGYYEQIPSERKKLLWLEDARHLVPIDTGWENVANEIAAFAAAPEGIAP
jgi:carboxylesterase